MAEVADHVVHVEILGNVALVTFETLHAARAAKDILDGATLSPNATPLKVEILPITVPQSSYRAPLVVSRTPRKVFRVPLWLSRLRRDHSEFRALVRTAGDHAVRISNTRRSITVYDADKDTLERVREYMCELRRRGKPMKVERPRVENDAIKGAAQVEVGQKLSCSVCLCDIDEPSVDLNCGHVYCKSCFDGYLKHSADADKFPITCAAESCNTAVSLVHIRESLSASDMDKLLQNSFRSFVTQNPSQYHYCSTPDCGQVFEAVSTPTGPVQCDICSSLLCTYCKSHYHDGLSCAEYQAAKHFDEASKQWMDMNGVRQCSNCGMNLQKEGGCNHVICRACQAHFCWVCMKVFPVGDQVYNHLRTEHGGYGDY